MNQDELLKYLRPVTNKIWLAVSCEKEPDLFTKAIQKFQGTKYSHALAIYYSSDFEQFTVANAHGEASQLDTLDQFHEIDEVEHLFEKDVTPAERLAFTREVLRLDGIDYSEEQIFDIGLEAIFGVKRDGNGIDGVICSEYADRLSVAAGLPSAADILKKPVDLLNPKDNMAVWDELAKTRNDFRRIA